MPGGLSSRGVAVRGSCGEPVAAGTGRVDDRGVLPVTPYFAWCLRARTTVWRWGRSCGLGYCRFEHADQIRLSPRRSPGSFVPAGFQGKRGGVAAKKKDSKTGTDGKSAGVAAERGGDGAEVAEDRVQVVERAAAIDVAKGSGMVCTRVPGSRADRRRQKVWRVGATCGEVAALMDHLRCEGIQRLVLESTSDYWRIWLRREAPCCIPGLAGRNLEDIPGSDGLLKIRKVKGTIACQETGGRADAYGRRAGKTRVIWLKLYWLFELGRGRCMTRLPCVIDAGWAMSSRAGGLAGGS